jgi:hypothetical protein
MLRNVRKWNAFQRKLLKKERISYPEALSIYEALYREALALGRINERNILDGLDVDIKVSRAIRRLAL